MLIIESSNNDNGDGGGGDGGGGGHINSATPDYYALHTAYIHLFLSCTCNCHSFVMWFRFDAMLNVCARVPPSNAYIHASQRKFSRGSIVQYIQYTHREMYIDVYIYIYICNFV